MRRAESGEKLWGGAGLEELLTLRGIDKLCTALGGSLDFFSGVAPDFSRGSPLQRTSPKRLPRLRFSAGVFLKVDEAE